MPKKHSGNLFIHPSPSPGPLAAQWGYPGKWPV